MSNIIEVAAVNNSLADRWLSYLDAKPATVETYQRGIKQFMVFLSRHGISNPTREDVVSFRDEIAQEHKAATVQGYLMAVKQLFKWTATVGIYPNVAEHIKAPKIKEGFRKDYLTLDQVRRVLKAVDRSTLKGLRDYALISLMTVTGLRTIEISRANVEDMRTLAGFTVLYIQGKGRDDKSDYVKIPPVNEEAIRAYLKERGRVKNDEPLFASIANRNGGGRMTTRSIRRVVKEAFLAVGLDSDRLTAHSLRHTAATLNLLNGGTPEETRQLLRHSNIITTMIYSHALERASNQSEARISGAIFGKEETA